MHEFAPIHADSGAVRRIDHSAPSPATHNPHSLFGTLKAGGFVHARGTRYRVRCIEQHADCHAVSLVELGHPTESVVLLTPFDRVSPVDGQPRWQRASGSTVAATVARVSLESLGQQRLGRIATRSRALEILNWQLQASRLLREGHATRLLIADEVGLGKTVQAGLVHIGLSEDPSRDRTLIVVPSGIRDQWCSELTRLFALQPTLVDAVHLRQIRRCLPPSVNPWGLPGVFVAAVDFVKQPEVLADLLSVQWTLVVLDEAHGLVGRTDRHRAAQLISRTSQYVLMLTATPHSGDSTGFERLQRIGQTANDRMLVIRRSRAHVGLVGRRRTVTVTIRSTPIERQLQAALRAYLKRLSHERVMAADGAQLTSWVLLKRAASSNHALLLTLRRRRDALLGNATASFQAGLPFDADPGELQDDDASVPAAVGAQGLRDRDAEVVVLESLMAQAAEASRYDRKVAAAVRLINRAKEPVIVFTEFRDTLDRVVQELKGIASTTLHGGMDRRERLTSERAFATGAADILVATDAASEGLNLQTRCRFVIHLDVPWNPTRLEQRIGRVDRMGQRRTVHAVTLTSDATDPTLLRRLEGKLLRIEHDLARVADKPSEMRVGAVADAPPSVADFDAAATSCALSAINVLRVVASRHSHAPVRRQGVQLPWVAVSRAMRRRMGLPPGVLIVFSVEVWTAGGTRAVVSCVPVLIELHVAAARFSARRLIESCTPAAAQFAAAHASGVLASGIAGHLRRISTLQRRVAAALKHGTSHLAYQPGLFDRRAITAALELRSRDDHRRAEVQATLGRLEQERGLETGQQIRPVAGFVLR